MRYRVQIVPEGPCKELTTEHVWECEQWEAQQEFMIHLANVVWPNVREKGLN